MASLLERVQAVKFGRMDFWPPNDLINYEDIDMDDLASHVLGLVDNTTPYWDRNNSETFEVGSVLIKLKTKITYFSEEPHEIHYDGDIDKSSVIEFSSDNQITIAALDRSWKITAFFDFGPSSPFRDSEYRCNVIFDQSDFAWAIQGDCAAFEAWLQETGFEG